jgi:hypothetical protein
MSSSWMATDRPDGERGAAAGLREEAHAQARGRENATSCESAQIGVKGEWLIQKAPES